MTDPARLSDFREVKAGVKTPTYDPTAHGTGIVHIGPGAFHRAHQAAATDDALAAEGGDWRITGVSLRSQTAADQLNPQNGLYTLLERSGAGTSARVIGSIASVISGAEALPALTDPATRIVSLTVTEKAYGIDRATGGGDPDHPAVAADLTGAEPTGVLGLLTEALRIRRAQGTAPFTVLCCDNLPENGRLLRGGVIDFAQRRDPLLSEWIAAEVAFPSTMVDRITPAATDQTRKDAIHATGFADHAAIETEPFTQWVIEDNFPTGRPAWEAGGALFVEDVTPYELMKLRMLNGAHSLIAYAGHLAGCTYVREAMAHPDLRHLTDLHMKAAAKTLPTMRAVDFDTYRADLIERFDNPAIAHQTVQIAMDGTEKLPQRIFAPAIDAMNAGQDIASFAFATAAWMAFAARNAETPDGPLQDPRRIEIQAALSGKSTTQDVFDALNGITGFTPAALQHSENWRKAVCSCLRDILEDGIDAAIRSKGTPA